MEQRRGQGNGRRGRAGRSRRSTDKYQSAQQTSVGGDTQRRQEQDQVRLGANKPSTQQSSARSGGGRRSRGQRVYQDYEDEQEVKKGLRDGTLFQGKLRINARRRSTAFVTAYGSILPCDIFLENEKARNRAQEGDTVVIRLSSVTEWMPAKSSPSRPLDSVVDALGGLSLTDTPGGGEAKQQGVSLDTPGAGGSNAPNTDQEERRTHSLNPGRLPGQAWEGSDNNVGAAAVSETELWRPSQKVVDGGNNSPLTSLCAEGILAAQGNLQPVGKVVFILRENHREEHMGSLVVSSPLKQDGKLSDKDSYVMFHPADRRVPHMLIARGELPSLFLDNPAAYAKSIFMARLKPTWSQSSKLPWGEGVRFVGEAGAIHAETEALLAQHGVNHGDFPASVMRALKKFLPAQAGDGVDAGASIRGSSWKIPDDEIARRRDLRKQRIFTIDPTAARDLDDALSVSQLADGTMEIGVHIADVTYFVTPNSELDSEARRRATTVYLVQQAIPMLPPLLCEELCSLNPGVDRLAYSCIWKMHVDGTLVDEPAWFGRTVICSCSKLDYDTAQLMIDGKIRPGVPSSITPELWDISRRPKGFTCDDVCKDVLLFHALAKERRAKRFASGALSLNTPKLTFKLDNNGNPAEFGSYPIRDSNRLVEEYMLLANFLVAQQTVNVAGDQAFLRMHPPPLEKGLDALKKTLSGVGIELETKSSASLHSSLKRISAGDEDDDVVQVLTMMATVPMKNAEYVAAGKADSWRHYALNIPIYTHFTSPIRRYADVMVHRVLTATLDRTASSNKTYDVDTIDHIATHCNEKRMAAKMAQERCDQVYLAVYLQSNPMEMEAVVVSMGEQSFTVNVPRLGITSRLYLDKIPDLTATFSEVEGALQLQASSTVTHQWTTARIEILSKIVVRCSAADKGGPVDIQVEFVRPLASPKRFPVATV